MLWVLWVYEIHPNTSKTMLTFWSEKHKRKKWGFNSWILKREFASHCAGACAGGLIFKRIGCFECMSSCIISMNLKWTGTGCISEFRHSHCFFTEIVLFLFGLCLHIVLRMRGTSFSNYSAEKTCCVLNTVLLGRTGLTIFVVWNSWRMLLKLCWYDDK